MTTTRAPVQLIVRVATDAVVARSLARRFALACGLVESRALAAAIVSGELASNLVRHGGGGELCLLREPCALAIRARNRAVTGRVPESMTRLRDARPTMVDELGRPLAGLGVGLDAVHRLSDDVVARAHEGWLEIVARLKWPAPDAGQ